MDEREEAGRTLGGEGFVIGKGIGAHLSVCLGVVCACMFLCSWSLFG